MVHEGIQLDLLTASVCIIKWYNTRAVRNVHGESYIDAQGTRQFHINKTG